MSICSDNQIERSQAAITLHHHSASRLMIGTNWFLGYLHQTKAKDRQINEMTTTERIADILEGA